MRDNENKLFGNRLRWVRNSLKLSQPEFAAKIGVQLRTYQNLESGKTERLEASALRALLKLGVDLTDLLGADEAAPVVAEPAPPPPGPDFGPTPNRLRLWALQNGQDISGAVPPHMLELWDLQQEFMAWSNRMVLKKPEVLDRLALAMRKLINEIELGRGDEEEPTNSERQRAS